MENIINKIKNKQILTKADLERFTSLYVNENRLQNEVRDISLSYVQDDNEFAYYDNDEKKIFVAYNYILKEVKENNDNNFYSYIIPNPLYEDVNLQLLQVILHELKHAKQHNIIKNCSKDEVIINALIDSFKYSQCNLYNEYNSEFIIEYNAELEASMELNELIVNNNLPDYNENIDKIIRNIGLYRYRSNQYRSLLHIFNYLVMSQSYSEFFLKDIYYNNYDYNNISSLDKILYGLPLEDKEVKLIDNLKNKQKVKTFEYFK